MTVPRRAPGEQVVGDATVARDVIQVQHVGGNVTIGAPRPVWWTRSGYIDQVRDIAPLDGLRDRDEELAELAAFCAGEQPYAWWRAGPWAGKSALMSTFVLHPPPGVRVVSFFITARLAAQSDSNAFTDALIDQLSAIVGESAPGSLSPASRDAHRRALLRAAVDKVRGEGMRLVLVVDGLDEDRGGRPGSGLASVASLLPKVCAEGLRVVVASRPDPPLPDDVPADHPLRRGCRVRELAVSKHATEIAALAGRELLELLHGDRLHQDILGLITACGGGLTLAELEELTGMAPYRLEGLLGGVFGRTVAGRAEHTGAGMPRLYLFTHETLRETAIRNLGAALGSYRDRLHTWAGQYAQGWPENTPQYLLRGYPGMLQATADVDRLVALAVDPVRHDRMLDLSGGDAAALTEVKTAQDLVLSRSEPDLYSMARLSIHRSDLETRNATIPAGLPAVWATLGQPTRAASLANGITDPVQRARALTGIARVLAAGDPDQAEAIAHAVTRPDLRAEALVEVVRAVAAAGDPERAEAIAHAITRPDLRVQALVEVIRLVAAAGDLDRAVRLAGRAEAIARTIADRPSSVRALAGTLTVAAAGDPGRAEAIIHTVSDPDLRVRALVELARAVAAAGDLDRALRLAGRAESIARTIVNSAAHARALAGAAGATAAAGDPGRAEEIARTIVHRELRVQALTDLARVAAAGDPGRAEAIARTIVDPDRQVRALAGVAETVAAAGDPDRGEAIARTIARPDLQAWALAGVAHAVAAGDPGNAARLASLAEVAARTRTRPYWPAEALVELAGAVAVAGDPGRAEEIIGIIADPRRQAEALAEVAGALAAAGDPDRAETLVHAIADRDSRERGLAEIARVVAAAGDPDRAETLVRTMTDPNRQAHALAEVAEAVAAAGDLGRAEALARTITRPYRQAEALAVVAGAVAAAGDLGRAEEIVRTVGDRDSRVRALVGIARAVAVGGDPDRAEALACTIGRPDMRAQALAGIARAVAVGGDPDRAEALARTIGRPELRAQALADIAETVAAAGDPERAARLADRAAAIARTLTRPELRVQALAGVAGAVAAGDPDRAAAIALTIARPDTQAQALAGVARAVAAAGDLARAEAVARAITDPDQQVRALIGIAEIGAGPGTGRLIARAFAMGPWHAPMPVLAKLQPDVVLRIANDVRLRADGRGHQQRPGRR